MQSTGSKSIQQSIFTMLQNNLQKNNRFFFTGLRPLTFTYESLRFTILCSGVLRDSSGILRENAMFSEGFPNKGRTVPEQTTFKHTLIREKLYIPQYLNNII